MKTRKEKCMVDRIRETWYALSDSMPGVLAVLCIVLIVLLGFGVGFGILWFMSWILMSVYNVLAVQFGWPIFSHWFWLGAWVLVKSLLKARKVIVRREKE